MLIERRIFVELHGVKEGPSSAYARALALEKGESIEALDTRIMFHVGEHSCSPYRSCYRVMIRSADVRGFAANHIGLVAQIIR